MTSSCSQGTTSERLLCDIPLGLVEVCTESVPPIAQDLVNIQDGWASGLQGRLLVMLLSFVLVVKQGISLDQDTDELCYHLTVFIYLV